MPAVMEVRSPFDGNVAGSVPIDGPSAIDRKLAAAEAAFRRWRDVPLADRRRIVEEGLSRFLDESSEIARMITLQMGKPIAQANREVETFLDRAQWALEECEAALSTEVLPEGEGLHRRIERVPLGIVLDIVEWTYPLLLPVNVIVPALLAGDVVALKHSERTPLTGDALARAFGHLEVPDLVVPIHVTRDSASRLIDDSRVAHVSVSGALRTGRAAYRRAAERLIDVSLELGGKDAAYVAADADLDTAVDGVVRAACDNAGQSHCAVERVYVHQSVCAEFVDRVRSALEGYRLGDPLAESTTMGPLAMREALDPLEAQVEDARSRGAEVLLGGTRVEDLPGSFFAPTLLVNVPNEASVMQEQSLAPIVAVRSVVGDDEAVALMNDTRFGLTASVWTRDRDRAERLAKLVDVGTFFQNRAGVVDPALPWSGRKESGVGVSLSRQGFLTLTKPRAISLV